MAEYHKKKDGILALLALALLAAALCLLPACACAAALSVRADGELCSFGASEFTVSVPADGKLTCWISDGYSRCRTLCREREVSAGVLTLPWDGLGANREQLKAGTYSVTASLETAGGTQSAKTEFDLARSAQAILYALPGSGTLWLEDGNAWFAEVQLAHKGKICMEVRAADAPDAVLTTLYFNQPRELVTTVRWNGRIKGRRVKPGSYVFRFYAGRSPSIYIDCPVTVAEGSRPVPPLAVTGAPDIPDSPTDAEIWALMMRELPVVTDKQPTHHQDVLAEPSARAKSLGQLHGRSQCVFVLELPGNGWARIGAWEHDTAAYIEGWVPESALEMAVPRTEYGILVDKRTQTLTLFREGTRVETIPVSTGLPTARAPYRETAAGFFLTDMHVEGFVSEGFHYDCVIRYDGGNLFHQIGYVLRSGKRDFTEQTAVLGEKASHGCIRLPPTAEDGGLNAWWLWTHIPYGTRVLILDDPAPPENPSPELTPDSMLVVDDEEE